jgi:hypothetical protein
MGFFPYFVHGIVVGTRVIRSRGRSGAEIVVDSWPKGNFAEDYHEFCDLVRSEVWERS